MKLEPNIPIASLGQKEPRRRYIEHTLAEICHPSASGPDGLLSTCCEYRPLSDSAGFTALTHRIKTPPTDGPVRSVSCRRQIPGTDSTGEGSASL
ncbi:Hypothetical protein SMAX5B_010655 [Scophthalmus maximus]|uniref:Uncharacterized protein n=1 Tax=Scophthalmus maximus TaxID=52904 RepID=A0A2U9B340_SCOMX|nr:Hypothetical protein SMAX5B_010655 [Scophthalmus maximus]